MSIFGDVDVDDVDFDDVNFDDVDFDDADFDAVDFDEAHIAEPAFAKYVALRGVRAKIVKIVKNPRQLRQKYVGPRIDPPMRGQKACFFNEKAYIDKSTWALESNLL